MIKEERLHLMSIWTKEGYYNSQHSKVAAEVLDKLSTELNGHNIKFEEDPTWPYHILVPNLGGKYISLFCGGFRNTIEIQQLKKDGTADIRFKEEAFSTVKGATNYLLKRGLGKDV